MQAIVRYFVERDLLVNLISFSVIALGLFYAGTSIKREAFPNINLDRIEVHANYPGATPEEMERLIVTPIEQEIKSLGGIDKMTSVSFPGSAIINLELDPNSNNRDRLPSDVQLAVNRADLPRDMPYEPSVTEIDGSVFPIMQLAVSSNVSELELKRIGDQIEDDLLELDGVARVIIQGERRAEISIVVDPKKMGEQRISVGDIANAIQGWNINAPGGELDTAEGQKAVRIMGEFQNAEDVANLVLRANERGGGIRLGDVANISEGLENPRTVYDVSGETALNIIVMKKSDADIIDVVDEVKEYIKGLPQLYGEDLKVEPFQDMSRFARMRLGVLTNNGMVGVVLVFFSLLLFLRPSVAMTTTLGLPIVFFSGLYILYVNGVTLNLISMMGFIMVLGMLVDDAIIIGENITYHMEQGMAPRKAAVVGASELIGPVTATVLTTIIAFAPMLYMSGLIGKFIVAIPTVVILLLLLSWFESFFILPSHVAYVARPQAHPKERRWLVALEEYYAKALEVAIHHRWIAVGTSIAVFIGSIILAKSVMSFQLFPAVGVDQFVVRVIAPAGTSLENMRSQLRDLDKDLRSQINADYLESTIISSGQIAMDSGDPNMQRGPRYGQVRVLYSPAVSRPGHNALNDMRQLEHELPPRYPSLAITFTELKNGPPTGRALEVELSSSHEEMTERVARRLMQYLQSVKGVTSIESGLQPGDQELHIVLDRDMATYAGVNLVTAASHVRAAVDGLRVASTRRGSEEVDITIRFPENTSEMEQLMGLEIPNQRGGLIPLSRIAQFEERPGYSTIRHKNGIRIMNVMANIDSSIITSNEINRLVREDANKWLGDEGKQIKVNYGGEEEKNQESVKDLAFSFLFAIIGIFFILAVQFNGFSYPLIVMLAIPFGAIGIILSFFFHDLLWKPMPLSFFSMLGMVALTGVVVNSSLILLVFVQRAREEGMHWKEAIIMAGRRRLRAVLLTAATTIFGLLPTAYGWGGLDPFVAPMALALSWGLIFATLITLLVIPSFLAAAINTKQSFNALRERFKR